MSLSPEVVHPRQNLTATITTEAPIDGVVTATLEWGYDNFYRYHRAEGAERAASSGHDWVCVTRVDLPVDELANGEFTDASFTVPSWAPGSSPEIARWSARLRIERRGGDVDERGGFTVVIGTADVEAYEEPLEHVSGAGDTRIDVVLGSPVYRAGDTIEGQIVLLPQMELPPGDVAVYWQRQCESHPLMRYPAADDTVDGPLMQLNKPIRLTEGTPVTLPFALPLPADAAPTASAVHSSLSWFVAARMLPSDGASHRADRVRRPITVLNAP
jgi:hypothetical protein